MNNNKDNKDNNDYNNSSEYRCFTYLDQLDEKTIDLLDEIVVRKTEDEERDYISKKAFLMIKKEKSETTKKILDIAISFFNNAGIYVNENNGSILYSSYYYNSSKYSFSDDYIDNITCANEAEKDVHCCIIVTKKGENLKGGDIEIYNKNPYTFFQLIGYEQEEKDIYQLKTGTVLVLDGDTLYKLQTFKGNGSFNFMIITLKDKNVKEDE